MIINFRSIYEKLFKSFNIAGDTHLINELERDKVKYVMVIKRSWIFGLFISWRLVIIFLLTIASSYLLYKNFGNTPSTYISMLLLITSVTYWFYSIIAFLLKFKRIYGTKNKILEISILKRRLEEGVDAFTIFFNQTIFNYFLLIGITIYTVVYFFIQESLNNDILGWGILNIILLFLQVYLSSNFKKRMIDLEMDYNIVIPGKIFFINQSGLYMKTQSMNADKIKTIDSQIMGFFRSIFNYGDLKIYTEGDSSSDIGGSDLNMYFVASPIETVEEINKLLHTSSEALEKENNLYLNKILNELGIMLINSKNKDNFEKIKNYLIKNNETIKNDFKLSQNKKTQEEIKEIYEIYMK